MNEINNRQNQNFPIDCIAAFRQKYSEIKRLSLIQTILSVWVPIILGLSAIGLNNSSITSVIGLNVLDISIYASFICVAITLIDLLFFTKLIESGKELATKIQERFDTYVLCLPWNTILAGSKPSNEDISRLKKAFYQYKSNKKEHLINWYNPKVSMVEHNKGVLLCQRMNLYWDKELRKAANKRIILALSCWILLICVLALVQDMSFNTLLLTVFLPLLPILSYSIKLITDNNRSIETITRLKDILESVWNDSHIDIVTTESLREIQNEIYQHRKTNRPISNKFYWKRKGEFEANTQYSIEKMIEEMNG